MKTKKPKNDSSLGTAKNHKAAAAITKLPPHEIKRAVDSGCGAFRKNGSVDCDALVKWLTENPPQVETDSTLNIHVERAKDIRANRMLKEQKFQEKSKLLLPVDKVRHCWFRNVISAKMKLYSADNQAAVEIGMKLGLSPAQVDAAREILAKHRRPVVKELHQGEFGKVQCPECKKEIQSI